MAKNLYEFQLMFDALDGEETGYTQKFGSRTEVESFAVAGGIDRHIYRDGREGIGDADITVEFYQARQFNNLYIRKRLNRSTLMIDRIYYRKLPFNFSFMVTTLSKTASFRNLELKAKNARIDNPPNRGSQTEDFVIYFSAPTILLYQTHMEGRWNVGVESEL